MNDELETSFAQKIAQEVDKYRSDGDLKKELQEADKRKRLPAKNALVEAVSSAQLMAYSWLAYFMKKLLVQN